jgi:multicomponent Na+:H+ antiporter subunit G
VIGESIALAGAVLTLIAAIGVARYKDALTRMHALTKASTVGLMLVAVGGALVVPTVNDATSALLAAVLYVLTLPISASMLGRATYVTNEANVEIDTVDELARRQRRDDRIDPGAGPARDHADAGFGHGDGAGVGRGDGDRPPGG